jgi:hypothetical protein
MEQGRHLRVVDTTTGDVLPECPGCVERQQTLDELTRKYHGALAQIGSLRADKEAEAKKHPRWPEAIAVFRYWQEHTGHKKSEWGPKRFELVLPFLEKHGAEECRRAIRGAAFDPFTTKRKNGRENVHNGFDLIFRSPEKFDDFRERAPDLPDTIAGRTLVEHAHVVAARVLERARLIERGEDPRALGHLLIEIDRMTSEWLELPSRDDRPMRPEAIEARSIVAGELLAQAEGEQEELIQEALDA